MRRMFGIVALLAVMSACALSADPPKVIELNADESKQSISLAERRQDVNFRRQKAMIEYQAAMNRFQEEDNSLNLEAGQLCFALKKAHKLDPDIQYRLDEWKAQLIRH